MRILRKPLSILLSILMVVSVLAIIPAGAAAPDTASESGRYSVDLSGDGEGVLPELPGGSITPEIIADSVDPAPVTVSGIPAIVEEDDEQLPTLTGRADLASTAADRELAETGHYNIAVGLTVVTDSNYNDILGDGRASYNPSTKVLTLREPNIYAAYQYKSDYGAIHIQTDGVTVRGSFHMTSAVSQYGLYVSGSNRVTLEGDFTFRGKQFGIIGNYLTFNSGAIKAISGNTYDSPAAIYSDDLTINSGITSVEMQCASCAYEGDKLTLNGVRITSDDFFYAHSRAIVNADITTFATRVVIKPWSGTYYDLWLGSRAVDSDNYADIYGDGTASYDPTSKILTLNDPAIRGVHVEGETGLGNNFKIYSENDLTVKGSYKMTSDQLILSPDATPEDDEDNALYVRAGIYSTGNLTLDGDFAFYAKKFPVAAENNVTVGSGTVKVSGSENLGIGALGGALTVKSAVTKVDAEADGYPLVGKTAITVESGVHISTPANSVQAIDSGTGIHYIMNSTDNTIARHVVIENGTVERYNLFLAMTEVTSANCDDIFGDGKASYSPSTQTLILHDPTINGTAQNGSNTYKIMTSLALTVKGSYHMSEAEADLAISSTKSLTLDGDFTFRGKKYAVYGPTGVTVKSGTLTAISEGVGAIGAIDGEFYVGNSITKVEMQSGTYNVLAKTISLIGVQIVEPASSALIQMSTGDGDDDYVYTLGNRDGTAAQRAVFEPLTGESCGVWLGSRLVTTTNCSDIFKDGGSAAYDPDTKTLTFSGATIPGYYKNGSNTFKIFAFGDLTVEGSFAMDEADVTIGLFSNGSLTLSGDFDFKATTYGVFAQGGITVSGGSLTANGGTIGVISNGAMTLGDAVIRIDATGGTHAILGDPLTLSDELVITTPDGGSIGSVSGYQGITSSGSGVTHAVIERKPEPVEKPTEPITDPPTDPPVSTAVCYVVGNFTDWTVKDAYRMTKNEEAGDEEFVFTGLALTTSHQFKIVMVMNGEQFWFPEGMGNNYGENGEITSDGACDVYFRPNYDGGDDWYYNCIYVAEVENKLDLEGEGTENAPYLIKTSDDWDKFTAYVTDGGNTSGKYFKLMNDITVTTAINTNPFSGIFDGDGHTLTLDNLTVTPFGNLNGATIRNLKVDGSVSGGAHVSALAGGVAGTADNLIENVVVAANITTSGGYCGGFVGHAGSTSKTTLKNCAFAGTISDADLAGTFIGWGDKGSTPALQNCIDVSSSDHPIGRGESFSTPIVTNTYYTNPNKVTSGRRIWNNRGKLAYTVKGKISSLNGTPGLTYDGTIYAGESDVISLTAPDADATYQASAGTLTQDGSELTLTMPAANVTIMTTGEDYTGYSDVYYNIGYNNEGADKLFDGNTGTKWCGSTNDGTPVVTFCTENEVIPSGYKLATANDTARNSGRNPISWTLEASADGRSWVTIADESDNHTLEAVNEKYYTFPLTNPTADAYTFFRFTIKALAGGTTFQLSELQLIGTDTGETADITYELWLGSVQVTFANHNDILGDGGKAKFNPLTNTLTLDNPTIEGEHIIGSDTSCKIYSALYSEGYAIVLKGSYHMTEAETDYGIFMNGFYVALDGDFTFMGREEAVRSNGDLTLRSGSLTAVCPDDAAEIAFPIHCYGKLFIEDNVTKVEAEGGYYPIVFFPYDSTPYSDKFLLTTPAEGYYAQEPEGSSAKCFFNADGTVAKHVVIEKIVGYGVWLGSTEVDTRNRNDILGDGKAQFDLATNTLTLNDPTFNGTHGGAKIYTNRTITVKGSYHMTEAEDSCGIYSSNCYLTLSGDFTFIGNIDGIHADQYLTIASGSVKAVGHEDSGAYSWWEMFIREDVQRVELEGGDDAHYGNRIVSNDHMVITLPEGGYISYDSIKAADGSDAKHAVIERGNVVAFEMNGVGTAPASQVLMDGKTASKPDDPAAEGYDFLGWFNDEELTREYDFSAVVEGDMTLYAKWAIKEYTVYFDENGHGAPQETQTVEHGSTASKPDGLTEPGYNLIGWFTDEELTQEYDFSTEVTSDLTLYAKWEAEEYTVTVIADNGTAAQYTEAAKFRYDDEYVLPECIFAVPEGKAFDGWDKGAVGDTIKITSDTVITAVWRKIFIVGDVDSNGMVNNRDAVILDRYIADWEGYEDIIANMRAADLNQDGKVNNRDAVILDRYIAVWDGYDKYIVKK